MRNTFHAAASSEDKIIKSVKYKMVIIGVYKSFEIPEETIATLAETCFLEENHTLKYAELETANLMSGKKIKIADKECDINIFLSAVAERLKQEDNLTDVLDTPYLLLKEIKKIDVPQYTVISMY